MTVASLATTTHSRPLIRPMPVTMLAAGTAYSSPSVAVHPERRQRAQLEERAAGVEQPVDAVADQQLAAVEVLLPGGLRAAAADDGEPLAQLGDEVGQLSLTRHEVNVR